jgi:hypothetical protein
MVIDAEFDKEDHSSIFCNCDREEVETTWCQNYPLNQIKLVVKAKKIKLVAIFNVPLSNQGIFIKLLKSLQ